MKSSQETAQKIVTNIQTVIVGKPEVVELAVICLLCQGHLLIEDVPGVGKTMLARSLAQSLGCSLGRIQFTPDMLPSDVTGVSIYNQNTHEFEFRPGPVMSEIVLADEINRATPKTQSALLEAMQERQVTVDSISHKLPPLFMVLATQNPIEHEGTFRLPEAQLDRFLMRIKIGYPEEADEVNILNRQKYEHPIEQIEAVVSVEDVLDAQKSVREMYIAPALIDYIVNLVQQTRAHEDVYLGASPRGSLGLYRASQARAMLLGRDFVIPDDIKSLADSILMHRMILAPGAHLQDVSARSVINAILDGVAVPGGEYLAP